MYIYGHSKGISSGSCHWEKASLAAPGTRTRISVAPGFPALPTELFSPPIFFFFFLTVHFRLFVCFDFDVVKISMGSDVSDWMYKLL